MNYKKLIINLVVLIGLVFIGKVWGFSGLFLFFIGIIVGSFFGLHMLLNTDMLPAFKYEIYLKVLAEEEQEDIENNKEGKI